MSEEWNHDRKHNRVTVNVTGDVVSSTCIDVINISLGGAMVESDRRMDIGKSLKFLLSLDDRKLVLTGKVIHASIVRSQENKRGESVPIYKAGIKFDRELTGEEKDIINSLNQ